MKPRRSLWPTTLLLLLLPLAVATVPAGDAGSSSEAGHFNVAYDRYPDGPDFVHLYGWLPGSTLTISVDDPGQAGIEFEVTDIFVASTDGFSVDIGPAFDIRTGDVVTVSDGVVSGSHVVTNLEIVTVDVTTDRVSGVADPDQPLFVTPDYQVLFWVEPDPDGSWQADMSEYDLQPGVALAAQQYDENGNTTQYDYYTAAPGSTDECKQGGWQAFGFRNQGLCMRWVNTGK